MATSIKKELSFGYGQGKTYFTCTGCTADVNVLGVGMCVRMYIQGTDGYAVYNSAAMNLLFPNATAHPYKMDSTYMASCQASANNPYIGLEIAGTEIVHTPCVGYNGQTQTLTGLTDAAILTATKSTVIRYHLYGTNKWNAVVLSNPSIAFYFWRYDFTAVKVGNAVRSVTVSSATGFEGDRITYSVTLKDRAVWHGWYSDAACTQLVSTSQSYTITAAGDLTLYAYATREALPTGLWLKRSGGFKQALAVWQKVNGSWEEISSTAALSGGENIHHKTIE